MANKEIVRTTFGGTTLENHLSPKAMLATRHDWNTNRHSNIDHELHLIVKGSCSVEVEDVVYNLRAGQGILILPDKFHKPLSASEDLDRMVLGFFPVKGCLIPDTDTACLVLDFAPAATALAGELMDEYANPGPFHQKLVHSMLEQLTIRFLRELGAADTEAALAVGSDLRVDVIDGFFTDFLAKNVTKEDLADRLHLSSRQLNRFLQKRYGMSFREKLLRARMLHAGWLLQHTEQSVRQIAPQVGYTSMPAFVRSFTRFHNKTPLQFREQGEKA